VIFIMQSGRNRHEDIMSSLELFGREVLPEFAERADAWDRAKAERLAPAVEAAMARRLDDVPAMPEGYVMTALPKQMMGKAGEDVLEKVAATTATGDSTMLGKLAADAGAY
jgi:hypothetical protein